MIINAFTDQISETLLFQWLFVDGSSKKHWYSIDETLMISIQTLMIINVFNVLISEALMFHWIFIDDSLKT